MRTRVGISLGPVAALAVAAAMGVAQVETFVVDFEQGALADVVASGTGLRPSLTEDPAEVIAGRRSLKGDSMGSGSQWNEFYHSPDELLQAGHAYTATFHYRVLAREADARFYLLLRSKTGRTRPNWHWHDWRGNAGDQDRMELAFRTEDVPDCYLIIGIQGRGAITVDDLTFTGGRVPSTKLPSLERRHRSPGSTVYYVDSQGGDDASAGTSEAAAWRTLDRVNSTEFAPGDALLLLCGGRWDGVLAPGGSGTAAEPIVVAPYGEGPRPCISAREEDQAAVYLFNQEFWEIKGLEVTNQGEIPLARRAGVLVRVEDFGTAQDIHLKNLYVHDVNGNTAKGPDLAGIVWQNGGDEVKSRFDGLFIEDCHLVRCDRNGVVGRSGHWRRESWFPSINVVIRGNLLEDIGGDAIVPIGCDGCLVEHNVVRGAGRRCPDAAAGIWPWSCDDTVIQFNEVSGHRAPVDGQGFDSDWNCRNTLIQYNYSHDNRGGFLLVCNAGRSRMPANIGNTGTVVRYNISQNDGTRHLIHIGGPVKDTHIYHNTCYVGPEQDLMLVHQGSWDGWADRTTFSNNLFHVAGKGRIDLGDSTNNLFRSNLVFGAVEGLPHEAGTLSVDPMLAGPGTGGDGLQLLDGYRLREGSPCTGAGVLVPDNGGRDFWGHRLPIDRPPDIGAHQRSANLGGT